MAFVAGHVDALKVEEVSASDAAPWWSFCERAGGSLFQSEPWAHALVDGYGFDVHATVVLGDDGEPVGGMSWCLVDDLRGERVVGLPFSDVGGPLLATSDAWPPLRDALLELHVPVRFRTVGDAVPLADDAVSRAGRLLWHGLDLTNGVEAAREAFAPAARRAVRRAQRAGLTTELLPDDRFVDAFMPLHVSVRKRKYGLLAQPRAFFDALRQQFSDGNGWFPLAAVLDGRVVAITVYLRWRDTLYYKFNASRDEVLPLRPNNLLVSDGIELACALGCRRFDFGASDEDQPGLARFKRQFGAEEKPITVAALGRPGDTAREAAGRGLLSEAQAVFCDAAVPDAVTARAGELLYRYFA